MKDEELLVEVKKGLKELSDYNDDEILIFIHNLRVEVPISKEIPISNECQANKL